jgi:hypothetical protein
MPWQPLLASITGSVDAALRLRPAYLTAEHRLVRHHINGRVPRTDAARTTLAEMGQTLGQQALEAVATSAPPETMRAWHRTRLAQTFDGSQHRTFPGRPTVDSAREALVVRMAQANRRWGDDRRVGAGAHLGARISEQTVGTRRTRHEIPPAPERPKTLTGRECIRLPMAVLGAPEVCSRAVWSGLRRLVSALRSCLQGGRGTGEVAGMTCLGPGGWRWPRFRWSPAAPREAERGVWLVRAAAPSRRILWGAWG